MPGSAGLQTNLVTWLAMAGMTACWLMSLRLVPDWKRDGYTALLRSLFGFVWLDFGLDIVLRFPMLAYNAVEWGNGTSRLVAIPVETVNLTLAYSGIFWLMTSAGYWCLLRRPSAGPLRITRTLNVELAYAAAVPVALICSILFYLTDTPGLVPLALLTPLAAVAALYVLPATIVWWDHFRRPGPAWRVGSMQLVVLLPAAVNACRSPYRENVAPLFLIPLLGAVFAGRRPALRKLAPAAVVCFLIVSSLVGAYRAITWENTRPEEVAHEMRQAGLVEWFAGDFGQRMARFHSFDSFLLTMRLVPRAQPYSERNLLVNPFIRAFVPRLVNSDKAAADAGEQFGSKIWAYEDPTARDHSGAAIAPSMPGDLYDAGGLFYMVLGGLIWGALMGLLDGWKAHLPAFCAAGVTALVATHCAMSIERDFDHEVAGLIQMLLVLVVVAGLFALARRRAPEFAAQAESTGLGSAVRPEWGRM